MNGDLHKKAQQLLATSAIEGLPPSDESWLREHLSNCAECALEAAKTQELLRALRGVPVMVPRDLAARTQLRVRLRAQENSAVAAGSGIWLWLVAAASWMLGLFSAPLVWHVLTRMGSGFGVPKLALEFGFVLWWAIPALAAVAAVLHQRAFSSANKTI